MRKMFFAAALAGLVATGAAQAAERLVYTGDLAATTGFMRDLAPLFQAETGIKVELHVADASTALRATARGESDLGGTTRPALADPRESGLTLYPVAWEALAVIVHPDNPVDGVSLDQLTAVVTGELDNWRDLGGADAPIELHLPADPLCGVGYNLRALLLDDPAAGLAADHPALDLKALETAVAENRGALGVTSFSSAQGQPLKVLALEGTLPSADSLVAGDYLLYQPLQVAMAGSGGSAERFVRFAQSPLARRILRRNGAVPYMDGLNLVRHQFDRQNRLHRAAQER